MNASTLDQSLAEAWLERGRRAGAVLDAAEKAPALFKPENVEQTRREFDRAVAQVAGLMR